MGKKKRLSRDQKRKARLAERARKSPPAAQSSLAYSGNRFKTPELIPIVLRTETGIYEAFLMSDRRATDHTVRAALEKLIHQLRAGPLPPFEGGDTVTSVPGQEEDLIVWNIRRNWDDLFRSFPHPGTETLIGILRTLLGSIETWSTPSPSSRGYLNFLQGFLRKGGIHVSKVSPETMEEEEEPEDPFLEVGRAWCEGDLQARAEFLSQAEALLANGQWQRVSEVAQQLIGEVGNRDPMRELSVLSVRAQAEGRPRLG
jgi:hypothetical protein